MLRTIFGFSGLLIFCAFNIIFIGNGMSMRKWRCRCTFIKLSMSIIVYTEMFVSVKIFVSITFLSSRPVYIHTHILINDNVQNIATVKIMLWEGNLSLLKITLHPK